jgi:hypothetical protein
MLSLSYAFLVFLTDIPLEWFTSASICGMNGSNRCPYPPFPFPLFPDTGTGSEYLNRTFVSSFTQPSARQGLQCLTLFQIGEGYPHP